MQHSPGTGHRRGHLEGSFARQDPGGGRLNHLEKVLKNLDVKSNDILNILFLYYKGYLWLTPLYVKTRLEPTLVAQAPCRTPL